jgi:hypothetical protein
MLAAFRIASNPGLVFGLPAEYIFAQESRIPELEEALK